MAEATFHFPPDFLWGTATSSHQVEGGNTENDWWRWEHTGHDASDARVFENHISGNAAAWWDGKAERDIDRMVALNTKSHRLSLEWSRIEPEPGTWNHDALDRYRQILRAMQAAGIQPMVTLHHFTNPVWLAEVTDEDGNSGWLNDDVVMHFRRYVEKAVGDLSDLCDTWVTINEPNVYAAQSYFSGLWPPGHTHMGEYFHVTHNMIRAHAAAYEIIHELQPNARVGIAKHIVAWHPRHQISPLDRGITRLLDGAFNEVTLTALKHGLWQPPTPLFRSAEMSEARDTLDFIGLNYYVRYDAGFRLAALKQLGIDYAARPGAPKGPEGWGELFPEGFYASIKRLHRQFHLPMYITENGVPDANDSVRPGFLLQHLQQMWKAVMFNWGVRGYYFWSLIDNFEWAEGYDPRFRFGLYEVDFETQERTLRESGKLYAEIAKESAISSDMVRRYAPDIYDEMFPGQPPQIGGSTD